MQRIDEERIPKKILDRRFYKTRMRGIPRNQWEGAVKKDSQQLLSVHVCRRKAENIEEWRQKLTEAMIQKPFFI